MPAEQRSLLLVKPDGVTLGITPAVLDAVRDRGARAWLAGTLRLDRELVDLWYPEIRDEPQYRETVEFLVSGPLHLIGVSAVDAFALTRAVKREWRSAYGSVVQRGLLHCPDGPVDFAHEWALFAPLADGTAPPPAGPPVFPWHQTIAAR